MIQKQSVDKRSRYTQRSRERTKGEHRVSESSLERSKIEPSLGYGMVTKLGRSIGILNTHWTIGKVGDVLPGGGTQV